MTSDELAVCRSQIGETSWAAFLISHALNWKKKNMGLARGIVQAAQGWAAFSGNAPAQAARISEKDIVDAYHYFLGRPLVLRQEHLDLKGTGRWLRPAHREATWRCMASIAGFVFSVAIVNLLSTFADSYRQPRRYGPPATEW